MPESALRGADLLATMKDDVEHTLKLLAYLLAVSLTALPAAVAMVLAARAAPQLQLDFGVDMTKNRTVFVQSETYKLETLLDYAVEFGMRRNGIVGSAVLMLLLPGSFLLIPSLSTRRFAAIVALIVAFYMVWLVLSAPPFVSIMVMTALSFLPYAALVLGVKLAFPPDSRLWVLAIYFSFFIAAGSGFFNVLGHMPADELKDRLLLSCVVLPAAREACLAPLRRFARALILDPAVGGTGVTVNRAMVIPALLAILSGFSTLNRVTTASISGPWFAASVLVQSALEIWLRLSIDMRDNAVSDMLAVCSRSSERRDYSRRNSRAFRDVRGTIVVPAGGDDAQAVLDEANSSFHAKQEMAIKYATAWLVLAEMLAEYIGIFASLIMTLAARSTPLMLQMQVMADTPDIFEIDMLPLGGVIRATLSMLAAEVLVDSLCCLYETRVRKLHLFSAWSSVSLRTLLLSTTLAGLLSVSTAVIFTMVSPIDVRDCRGINGCFCADGNGIRQGTMLDRYCKERLFPHSDGGYPEGLLAIFVVEGPGGDDWPYERLEDEILRRPLVEALPVRIAFAAVLFSDHATGSTVNVTKWMDSAPLPITPATVVFRFYPPPLTMPQEPEDGPGPQVCHATLPEVHFASPLGFDAALRSLFNATDCAEDNLTCVASRVALLNAANPKCFKRPS